jgi:hypothetical protein
MNDDQIKQGKFFVFVCRQSTLSRSSSPISISSRAVRVLYCKGVIKTKL